MATGVPATPRETWLDWVAPGEPEPPLITREELANVLHERDINADVRHLRYWEAAGVLPQAVRRWHAGATRALYPVWAPWVVAALRDYQRQGLPLEEITPRLRETFYQRPDLDPEIRAFGDRLMLPALMAYVNRHRDRTGDDVAKVRVGLYDQDGREVDYIVMSLNAAPR